MEEKIIGEVISQKEAANLLHLSIGTINRLVSTGELKAFRFGKQIRILTVSLEDYIKRSAVK